MNFRSKSNRVETKKRKEKRILLDNKVAIIICRLFLVEFSTHFIVGFVVLSEWRRKNNKKMLISDNQRTREKKYTKNEKT